MSPSPAPAEPAGRAPSTRDPRPAAPAGPEAAGAAGKAGFDSAGLFARIEASGLRTRVSRATGADVRSVPMRAGNAGVGRRGVAHAGAVTLAPGATLHDAAHELAHAAQQRATDGALVGAGEAERRADAAADAALSGGSAPSLGRVPAAAVQGDNDPYSREAVPIPAPPAGMSVKDLKDQCDQKVTAGDITSYGVSGVKAGDPEEPFLYNAIFRLANTRRWGSEMDLVTTVGAGKGMVTVRFTDKGAVTAELVGKNAPVVTATYKTAKDAIDGLKKSYKLADVKGEKGKSWSVDELNKVSGAWSRLSTAEAAALEGFTLIRTDSLVTASGEKLQGQTTHSDEVETGKTVVKHTREMRFADSAFADDDKSFIGDKTDAAPASYEILIHEVGHAVEAKPFDDLNRVAVDDMGKANAAGISAHAAQLTAKAAIGKALKGKYPPKDSTAAQPMVTLVLDAHKSIGSFEGNPDAAHETAATTAVADRDTAKKAIAAGNKVVTGFADAIAKQDAYLAETVKLRAARDTATASQTRADALKASSGNTKRLQNFVDFVDKEGIKPFTAYAKKHWPGEPAEFYDEAFSIWKNDPVFLDKHAKKLKAWFDGGNHLK